MPSTQPTDRGSNASVTASFARAIDRFGDVAPLAVVPLVTGTAAVGDLVALADAPPGFSISFGMPVTRVDAWTFLDESAGRDGAAVGLAYPGWGIDLLPLAVAVTLGYVLLAGVLTAGYVGSLRDALGKGTFDFAANARRYAAQFVGFELLILVGFALLGGALFVSPALFGVTVVGAVAVAYLIYPTLYLVVLEDRRLAGAVRRAVALTTGPDSTGAFFVTFVVLAALCSVPMSVLARTHFVGGLLVVVAAAPLGVVLNVAALSHVGRLVGRDPAAGDGQSNAPVDR